MKSSFLPEIAISIVLLIFLIFLINPTNFWMPEPAQMLLLVGLTISFILFASFIWKEKASDEREVLHRAIASRFAYIVGTTLMVIGVIVQELQHGLDKWLVVSLAGMIFAKIVGFIYSQLKH